MNKEEREKIENHFKSALDNLIIDIQGIPASEIVLREQSMILFYKRVMLEIEKRDDLISKLQKENDTLKTTINKQSKDISEQLKELDKKDKKIKYKDNIIQSLGTEVLPISIEGFEVLLNKTKKENEKLQKVINLMAEDRAEISQPKVSKEAIIDFYFKKVDEEND